MRVTRFQLPDEAGGEPVVLELYTRTYGDMLDAAEQAAMVASSKVGGKASAITLQATHIAEERRIRRRLCVARYGDLDTRAGATDREVLAALDERPRHADIADQLIGRLHDATREEVAAVFGTAEVLETA